jgi:carnitine 3-dehydrogenase
MRGEDVLATGEQMLLHVSAETGRAAPAGERVLRVVRCVVESHAALALPDGVGRRVELPAKVGA